MTHDKTRRAIGFAFAVSLMACNKQEPPAPQNEPVTDTPKNEQGQATSTAPTATAPSTTTDATAHKTTTDEAQKATADKTEAKQDAADLIEEASATLQKMTADSNLKKLLTKSSGVFIVPHYGRAAAGVGVRGGEGVLLAHRDGKWSDPVFYNIGGISIGPQFGAQGGDIAMVLMGEQPLNSFKENHSFSLNAGANLTALDYSAATQASLSKGGKNGNAVIFWSNTNGAFAGATLSATNIMWDDDENEAYYGKQAAAQDILSGKVSDEKQGPLQKALSSL